ncbi:unnamed protein product [Hydatigera taeniaeformis]|uniref:Reverse transcriptase n=1 Tax=Hydatigena taeniaeformis TaxID=6205 RepID=A0A0R3XDL7_HYDTA|nr:unnamed protein product [Hydatigera taeniaeformis]
MQDDVEADYESGTRIIIMHGDDTLCSVSTNASLASIIPATMNALVNERQYVDGGLSSWLAANEACWAVAHENEESESAVQEEEEEEEEGKDGGDGAEADVEGQVMRCEV